jgi:phosphohistidine phosphatase SixA
MPYLLLMRHADHEAATHVPGRKLSSKGMSQVKEVAERLHEVLEELETDHEMAIRIARIEG